MKLNESLSYQFSEIVTTEANIGAIESFLSERAYSQSTKIQYRRILNVFLDDMGGNVEHITALEIEQWLNSKGGGGCSRWLRFCAIRSFLRWGWGDGHAGLRLKVPRGVCAPGRALTPDLASLLLDWFDRSTPKGIRDIALASLLLDSGLRAAEVCRAEMHYLYLKQRRLSVIGKGGDWRDVLFGEITTGLLRNWLEVRGDFANAKCRTIFVGISGRKPGSGLTPGGLKAIVRDWGVGAGIGPLSPHDFRRGFATMAVNAGASSRLVQVAGGWQSLEMVELYTQSLELESFRRFLPVDIINAKTVG